MDTRQLNALEIAARRKIKQRGDVWVVPSQHGNEPYEVKIGAEEESCNCSDFYQRRRRCKHIWAVHFVIERDSGAADTVPLVVKEPIHAPKPTYPQD